MNENRNEIVPPPGGDDDMGGPLPTVTPLPPPPRDMRQTEPPGWQERLRKALILS